ncbi:toxin-antitoxin system HicB family antitoxin [Amycolatopsis sp.]|jgi:hypothetical protein|uniref:toxin-antitoxin system HicB family antitoxin n=1 Tax=Amycolatopsis sp. TaxID=37632 RepID=UPI002E05DFA2|nr:ribbon-helix-helix protein, CopG family [Amycolatopsis sp.]
MDLTTYVDKLGRELAALIETGGDDAQALVERLSGSLDSAIRLTLLDALSGAADEITRDLAPGSVEVRLRGRDPNFVVRAPQPDQPFEDTAGRAAGTAAPEPAPPITDESATARINFRLPDQLKAAIEEAAAKEGRSVNAWLVRVSSAALQPADRERQPGQGGKRGAQRVTGWVR